MNEFIIGFSMMFTIIWDAIKWCFNEINWHFVGFACSIIVIMTVVILVSAFINDKLKSRRS